MKGFSPTQRHSRNVHVGSPAAARFPEAAVLVALAAVIILAPLPLQADPVPEPDPGQLPRLPATAPAEAIATFQIKPGFRIEQVAAEPLVADPVAIAFDEDGRLFVAEMRGYSERREEALGRIRLLTDSDGDGRFDHSSLFADGLKWPTGLICWEGGVFVLASPDLLYFPDSDGDGRADARKVIFSGFGAGLERLNVQALPNSLVWGPDNRIHGATAMNGGRVGIPGTGQTLALDGRDFSFDPLRLDLRAENGGGQYGMAFDSQGRKFVCSNSNHLQWIAYAAACNLDGLGPPRIDIPVDGPSAEVFRTSPDEPWRVVRTQWRVRGQVSGPVEGGGRPSGYFTAATGITLFRGNGWPRQFVDNAFVCDAGSNLLHRKIIRRSAGDQLLEAIRPDDERGTEFLTSTDNWFRPVQAANGPDGALYIVDMYREVIEHPWSLPESIKKHLDLNSGNDRGRIYRIVPDGFTQPPTPVFPRDDAAAMAALLAHPNGWHRDTAARLILERQGDADRGAISAVAGSSPEPAGRCNALAMLASLGALEPAHIARALQDPSPMVRRRAIQLFPAVPQWSASLSEALAPMARDADPEVAFTAGLVLGQLPPSPQTLQAFATLLAAHPDFSWTRQAAFAGLKRDPVTALPLLLAVSSRFEHPALADTLQALIEAAAKPLPPSLIEEITRVFTDIPEPLTRLKLVRAAGITLPDNEQLHLQEAVLASASDATAAPQRRQAAILELPGLLGERSLDLLAGFVTPAEAPLVQQAALASIGSSGLAGGGETLLRCWPVLSPGLQRAALDQFFRKPAWHALLLDGLETGTIPPVLLQPHQISALRDSGPPALRERAQRMLAASIAPGKADSIARFTPALSMQGNPGSGRVVFENRCATCHRKGDIGNAFGPDVNSFQSAGAASILTNLIDPNREVQPRYAAVIISLHSGEVHTGYIVDESDSTVTLRELLTGDRALPRTTIAEWRTLGVSAMPEGLESGLSQQQMADLLAFITERH